MKKKVFKLPYIGCEDRRNFSVIYGEKGNPIVIMKVLNPVLEMSADIDIYNDSHEIFLKAVKTLSNGMLIQKTDIINQSKYVPVEENDTLSNTFQEHFRGRAKKELTTYISITPSFIESRRIAKYSKKEEEAFFNKIDKVVQIFAEADMTPQLLKEVEIDYIIRRFLTFNFDDEKQLYAENILADDSHIRIGEKYIKSITIVDTDIMAVPSTVSAVSIEGGDSLGEDVGSYPIDNMKILFDNDDYQTLIYNQVIEICNQTKTVAELEIKKRRSISVPDASNTLGAEDIDAILSDIARENQLLVRGHFNILVGCNSLDDLKKCVNFFESAFFSKGFITGRNSFNQMELFRTCLFGNANELKHYDMFLTSSDSAVCFFFKEKRLRDEDSDYYLYFTDRQGIPVKIDPEDLPIKAGRIANRNKFVLGPSGTGKSFLMNSFIAQMLRYNMDIVIIDTGNSYIGTCDFFGGKYITYQENNPITMNPFKISKEEKNLEKIEFLSTLILLIFKDKGTSVSQDEYDIIADVLEEYYNRFFNWDKTWYEDKSTEDLLLYLEEKGYDTKQAFYFEDENIHTRIQSSKVMSYYKILGLEENCETEDLKIRYRKLAKEHHPDRRIDKEGQGDEIFKEISLAYRELLKMRRKISDTKETRQDIIRVIQKIDESLEVGNLSFNSFYEFSCQFIPMVLKASKLTDFNFEKYKYVLKKFYKGGRFETILNEDTDSSLLEETFIVFEIDNVKDNPILFPIVTLVIMDLFLQKMRLRDKQRKALIIEEAWKAIASELMGGYILYLFKTVRKFWGQCIVVTQELGDIIDNPVVKDSIISNSDSIILLEQTKFKDNFDKIASLLSLNAIEQAKIFTINQMENKKGRSQFKEFYIKRGATGEVYGNEVSLFQYLAFTTEKPEKNAISIYKDVYKSYEEAIKRFIEDMLYTGLSLPKFTQLVNSLDAIPTDEIKKSKRKNKKAVLTN